MYKILFKAKRIDNGKWVEGYLFQIWERAYILWGTTNDVPNMIEVDADTICQYTGLTDKNGNKIWENDIVEVKSSKRHFISQIEFDDYGKGFMLQDSKTSWCGLDVFTSGGIYRFGCEVIGNIFDNADLVKE